MRKTLFTLILMAVLSVSWQSDNRVTAERMFDSSIGKTRYEISKVLKGVKHIDSDSTCSVYFIYSERDKKKVPLQFTYRISDDDSLRVCKIEFVDRKSEYPTNDLQQAFWIEYLKSH